ncbi:hypothetical protein [Streptomyces xinghaiensis]|uniref:hypothetical protein n=1 Tax=Streptomyces xinghaiensis TaxID=1038928 RepID=UPI002E113DD3|nr:hypothetical protein OG463_00015 [Streptomyces xinghaiensis]WSQ75075.1 hypothetical protein OG463_29180 [Streptomyces xinghaiensis]
MELVVVLGGLLEAAFESLVGPCEFVDAFGQVPGAEGVELLSELVLDGLPHPVPVVPRVPDLLPGEFAFCAQRCCGAPGTCGRGDGGLPTL